MITIPFQINKNEFNIFLILEKENLDRMKDNDPAQISMWKFSEKFRNLNLKEIIISSPTEEDIAKILVMLKAKDNVSEALKYLSRGFKIKPGDNDSLYESTRLV